MVTEPKSKVPPKLHHDVAELHPTKNIHARYECLPLTDCGDVTRTRLAGAACSPSKLDNMGENNIHIVFLGYGVE